MSDSKGKVKGRTSLQLKKQTLHPPPCLFSKDHAKADPVQKGRQLGRGGGGGEGGGPSFSRKVRRKSGWREYSGGGRGKNWVS